MPVNSTRSISGGSSGQTSVSRVHVLDVHAKRTELTEADIDISNRLRAKATVCRRGKTCSTEMEFDSKAQCPSLNVEASRL